MPEFGEGDGCKVDTKKMCARVAGKRGKHTKMEKKKKKGKKKTEGKIRATNTHTHTHTHTGRRGDERKS